MFSRASVAFCIVQCCGLGATVGETDRFIPLVQDGGGWTTQIHLVNLSEKAVLLEVSFMTAQGAAEDWKLELNASQGTVRGARVEMILPPGGGAVIKTSGKAGATTRGFAEIVQYEGLPIGAFAKIVRTEEGRTVESFSVPLSPGHESKSLMLLDFSDEAVTAEMVWVSPTSSTTLELTFRKENGELAFSDLVTLDGKAQIFVKMLEVWPNLRGFRGTMEWKVSFPAADRYEYRYLSGLSVWKKGSEVWSTQGFTLKGDQQGWDPH